MTPQEKEKVRDSILTQLEIIHAQRYRLDVKELEGHAKRLCNELLALETTPANAYQYVEDAIRYVKQHLADIAMHTPARQLSTLQNHYRTQCHQALGHRVTYHRKRVKELLFGYLNSPARVMALGAVICAVALLALLSYTLVVGTPALIYDNDDPVPLYYYPYFVLVTFATLGYGDVEPNSTACGGWWPSYVSAALAISGIIVLGFLVVILISSMGAHPYARPGKWFDDYERQILKGPNGSGPPPAFDAGIRYQ